MYPLEMVPAVVRFAPLLSAVACAYHAADVTAAHGVFNGPVAV